VDRAFIFAANPDAILALYDALAAEKAAREKAEAEPFGWMFRDLGEYSGKWSKWVPCEEKHLHVWRKQIEAGTVQIIPIYATPPAPSRAEVVERNAVIEECARVADAGGRHCVASAIRKLKDTKS
jgi:hypothetical protein